MVGHQIKAAVLDCIPVKVVLLETDFVTEKVTLCMYVDTSRVIHTSSGHVSAFAGCPYFAKLM